MVTFNGLRQMAEMRRFQPSNPNPSSADHYAQLYNVEQSSSYAHQYPYYLHQTHNHTLVEPPILPPGIDSYAAINSYPPTHVGLESQVAVSYGHHVAQIGALTAAAYYQDTGNSGQSCAAKESICQFGADHTSYTAAIKSLNKEPEVPTSLTPMVWNNWNHPSANDPTKIFLTKPNVMQAICCEVCKIECNSKDVYYQHILGKKHKSNLKKQEESRIDFNFPTTTIMQSNPGTSEIGNMPYEATFRLNGAQTLLAAYPNLLGWIKPKTHCPAVNGNWREGVKKTKIVQSAWCEICKIDCNSKDVLDNHKLGKKHKKNLEKLEESKAQASALTAKDPMIGPKENPAADKGKAVRVQESKKKGAPSLGPGDVLETKRRKLMEGGVAADAVSVCTVCNVVVNSQTVFAYHLAGQKHVNMVEKQAEAAAAAGTANPPGPGVVFAA
ncbi:zinc finger protein 385B-like isoform X1 [Macadamia integrifolia]|uniref:zinc finger protein 385B-like isoform X1 n=1 Tax=Macadamia integrifolia TaxID=60698 RepID=UPI001C4F8A7C|nr:zinc finger protein 385B-like isoform X1 [Macadamia integrifolia]XP_042499534.1 zinc finger protein 385B-like isoform X1 [Macadamia integrifolia]